MEASGRAVVLVGPKPGPASRGDGARAADVDGDADGERAVRNAVGERAVKIAQFERTGQPWSSWMESGSTKTMT